VRSRSGALLDAAQRRLAADDVTTERIGIRDLAAQALLHADFGHPDISRAIGQVARARVIVIATPVYKAAYSGVLKVFLDLLPQDALRGKTVLALATGGSANHMLAVDYALRPVLQSLGAKQVLQAIYATDSQVVLSPEGSSTLADDINQRLNDAVDLLVAETLRPVVHRPVSLREVTLAPVRCSA
jgi:FMN reductase